MKWQKLGRIFDPNLEFRTGLSASLMPIAEPLDSDTDKFRIYFAPRDQNGQSELHYFDIDLKEPMRILNISEKPLIAAGQVGAFDDSGITPGNIATINSRKFLYYTGWNLTKKVPFNNSIGVAEMNSNGVFVRLGDGPILTRTLHEPYSCASPFVLYEDGCYRMWYASMDKWEPLGSGAKHFYNIKYCESSDGINWIRNRDIVIDYGGPEEYAFGRPFVVKDHDVYRMWYSYRGDNYRIGYAESLNGKHWRRCDELVGIDVSESGWDSVMIEYPFIFRHKNEQFMLYNGNEYGKSGIGLAKLLK